MNRTSVLVTACAVAMVAAGGAWAQPSLEIVKTFTSSHNDSLDGAQGIAIDITGDDEEELIAWNGRMLQVIDSNNTSLVYLDEPRSNTWDESSPLIVRVGTNRYVALKQTGMWGGELGLVTLYNDPANGYTMGGYVQTFPLTGSGGRYEKVLGDPVVLPGQTKRFVACRQTNGRLYSFDLTNSPTGALSMTVVGTYDANLQSNCAATATPGVHLGNGVSRYTLWDGTAFNDYVLCTDIFQETAAGLTCRGSWVAANGDPQLTVPIGYAVHNHIDGSVVVNRGTASAPDYWIYAMWENDALLWGQLTVTPTAVTIDVLGTHLLATRGFSVTVGRVQGLGTVIQASDHVFDLDGNVLATGGTTSQLYYSDYASGGRLYDGGGIYEYNPTTLTMDKIVPATGNLNTHANPPGTPHHQNGSPGISRFVGRAIAYDSLGYWKQRIVVISNADAATLLELSDTTRYAVPATQAVRDANLAMVQMAHITRGWDFLQHNLAIGTPVPSQVAAPNPLCATAPFDDGTLGPFQHASGSSSAYTFANSQLRVSASMRAVLPSAVYTDQTAMMNVAAGMPNGSWMGFLLRAATEADDHSTTGGTHTLVYIRRASTNNSARIHVKHEDPANPGSFINTSTLIPGHDCTVDDASILLETSGSLLTVYVNGVLIVTYTAMPNPALGGYTSIRGYVPGGSATTVDVDNAFVRPAGFVPDATKADNNGTIWVSLLQRDLVATFNVPSFSYTFNGTPSNLNQLLAVMQAYPQFVATEAAGADIWAFGFTAGPFPPVVHGVSYGGQTETALIQ